jgi:hypothetical protein
VSLERADADARAEREWAAADVARAAGDCGAAAGPLAAVLAIEAAVAGGAPQLVRGAAESLLVRR